MFEPDLFAINADQKPRVEEGGLDLPGVFGRLTAACERPRYAFMVLNLIAKASAGTGCAGPYVANGDTLTPVREWLCNAMAPMTQRASSRMKIAARVRAELIEAGGLPRDPAQALALIEEIVEQRVRSSGLTNVSRAVSELVRAGLLHRHYQGFHVDHQNRGAQRQAVYTLTREAHRALTISLPACG